MEEIIDAIMYEIENSGVLDKLSAGIVFTGGGALLRHLPQLVKFRTGLDVRIGYPVEQLAAESIEEVNQPMFSTSVGLLLKGYDNKQKQQQMIMDARKEKPEPDEGPEDEDNKKPNLFENLKIKLDGIFRENDSTM